MGLTAAVQGGPQGSATDPVGWLSAAAHVPRDDLEQVRLLRIHVASNKMAPQDLLTRALDTLDRVEAALGPRLPE